MTSDLLSAEKRMARPSALGSEYLVPTWLMFTGPAALAGAVTAQAVSMKKALSSRQTWA
jgi:hypothetical protein